MFKLFSLTEKRSHKTDSNFHPMPMAIADFAKFIYIPQSPKLST